MPMRHILPAAAGILALALTGAPADAHPSESRPAHTAHRLRHHSGHPVRRGPPAPVRTWKAQLDADLACHADEYPWRVRFLQRWSDSLVRHAASRRAGRHARPRRPAAWGLLRYLVSRLGPCPPAPEEEPAGVPLLDDAGRVVAEIGDVELGDAASVRIGAAFADPVVILGPPGAADPEPGVVRVTGVAGDRFDARFEEWSYLDGVHGRETAAYLVVESGRHALADGSIWEAGSFDLDGVASWRSHTFDAAFPAAPRLFLTVQTGNEEQAVVVRARAVGEAAFEAALFEEQAATDGHAPERVGYLAVWSPPRAGRLASEDGSLPYLARRVALGDQRLPLLSHALWLEEETSADDETGHGDEDVDVLAVGTRLFAQETSGRGADPAALRRSSPRLEAVEWGVVPDLDEAWQTIPLARSYERPVVVVRPLSSNGAGPGLVRVRNAGSDAFEARVQEWSYQNGDHAYERAFYLVAEEGVQALAGLVMEASRLETDRVLDQGLEPVSFSAPFADVPAVFGGVMSENGPEAVLPRVAERTAAGFGLALQEEEADTDGHAAETVGWIAVQRGRGVVPDGRVVSVFDTLLDPALRTVSFGETLRGRYPVLVGQVTSANGSDPVELRLADLTPADAVLFLQEEQSRDPETNHAEEEVSLFVAE